MQPSHEEEIGDDFGGFSRAYRTNGIVFACELTRMQVFSQARFMYQALRKGQPDDLFSKPSLDILEHPWPGGTTGDLLTQMLADADLYGNAFHTIRSGQIVRMRPDWVSIVIGSFKDREIDSWDLDAQVLGYIYYPGGKRSGREGIPLRRELVSHFKPIPDPAARFRGMSWLSPLVREVMADGAATAHKLKFFENAATPNLVIKRGDPLSGQSFLDWVDQMEEAHAGVRNAYKTLYMTQGADATVVGADLKQLEFKATQGAGETRIAAAAGVHPVIVGLSEGMQGSSLNAGNFNSARRLVADKTLWHLWSNAAGSLETIIPPPSGSRLWVDDRIPFLREDRKDLAEIQQMEAATMRQLLDGGFTPESIKAAIIAQDWDLLEHTGLYSVQLQPPGTVPLLPATTNGSKPDAVVSTQG
jgi:phage portal protein BeeE